MNGKGNLTLTGQLGDVMKESASAALTFVRSNSENFGIENDFNEKTDIHVHVPQAQYQRMVHQLALECLHRFFHFCQVSQ